MKRVTIILMVAVLASASQAASLSWSLTSPTVDEADIANFTGVSADADNVNGGDDSGTFIANNRPAVSQTFTTGSDPGGYVLNAITLQHVSYASDTTLWSVDSGWGGTPFEIKVGLKDGTASFTPLTMEFAAPVVSGIPALDATGQQSGTGTGAYATFTLETPITLAPNTTYGFSVWSSDPYFETNGDGTTSDNYTGGEAFGVFGNDVYDYTGDRVFHLNIELPDYVVLHDPTNGQTDVAVDLSDRIDPNYLSWVAPPDPNIVSIQGYDIYVDPNEQKVTSRDSGCLIADSTDAGVTQYDPPSDFDYSKTYYWTVDTRYTRDDGPGTYVGEPNVWRFTTISATPIIETYESVVVTESMPAATLAAVVTDGDGDLSTAAFTLLTDDINFPAGATAYLQNENVDDPYTPSVELFADTPGYYKVRLVVEDAVGNVAVDRAEVALYDDPNACAAAQFNWQTWEGFNLMDFDQDCHVGLADFAEFVRQWLDDQSLTEAESYDWYIPYYNENNGMPNGDFESGDFAGGYWVADATITTMDPIEGYYSAEWTVDADGSGIIAYQTVKASTNYEFSVQIIGDGFWPLDEFGVRYEDGTWLAIAVPTYTPTPTLQTVTTPFTTGADDEGVTLEFVMYGYGTSVGYDYKVDDLRLIEVP